MKAIRVHQFGDPSVLQLEEIPKPQPGPGQVLVRVHAAGVNPYDTYMRSGGYADRNPKLPYTPGSDAAGVVESVGPETDTFEPGTRVYTTGTLSGAYAEYAICASNQVHPLPERIAYSQAAALYVPYATAYRALFQFAQAKPGEIVLIHGASGGVGLAAIQWARGFGLRTIGTAGSEKGLQLITEQGAEHSFNHNSPGYQDEVLEATTGHRVNVILEMLANANLAHDLKMLAHRGRVVVIGSRGDVQITPRDLIMRETKVMGILIWRTPADEAAEIYAAIDAGLKNGTLQPVVRLELPLTAAAESHRRLMESGALGKIVLML